MSSLLQFHILFSPIPQTYPTSIGTMYPSTRRSAVWVFHRKPASTQRRRSVASPGMDRTGSRHRRTVCCVKCLGGFSAALVVCCSAPASFASLPGNSLFFGRIFCLVTEENAGNHWANRTRRRLTLRSRSCSSSSSYYRRSSTLGRTSLRRE
jgi:hypothetical protein